MPNIIHSSGFWRSTKPPPGSQINWDHPLSKGLVGCWLMNEGAGSITRCLVSPSNTGKLTNGARFKDNGVYTDGIDDRIAVPNFGNVLDGKYLTAFIITSVASWPSSYPRFVDRIHNGQFAVYAASSVKTLGFAAKASNGSLLNNIFSNQIIPTGKKINIATTWNGSIINAWINTIKSSVSFTGPGLASSTSELNFGNRPGYIDGLNNCILYAIYLWPFALSDAAILALNQDPYCFILPPTVRRYFSPLATPLYAPDAAPAKARSVVKISRDQKPPIGSQINWDHPLSKGLVGCWLFNGELRNLTGRPKLSLGSGGNAPQVGNDISLGQTYKDYLQCSDSIYRFTDGTYSFAFKFRLNLNFYQSDAGIIYKRSLEDYVIGTTVTGGYPYWIITDSSSYPWKLTSSESLLDGKSKSLLFSKGITARNIYVNGNANAQDSHVDAITSSGNVYFGANYSSANPCASFWSHLYIYRRDLNAAEASQLHQDPYCFILPPNPPRRIFTPLALLQPPPRPTSWALRAITGGNRPTLWHDRQEIADQQATTWNDREIIAGDRDAGWRVRMKVEDDRTAEWQVREAAIRILLVGSASSSDSTASCLALQTHRSAGVILANESSAICAARAFYRNRCPPIRFDATRIFDPSQFHVAQGTSEFSLSA